MGANEAASGTRAGIARPISSDLNPIGDTRRRCGGSLFHKFPRYSQSSTSADVNPSFCSSWDEGGGNLVCGR